MLWTKKIDEVHIYNTTPGEYSTICGKPTLGNNYMRYFVYNPKTGYFEDPEEPKHKRRICPDCLKALGAKIR